MIRAALSSISINQRFGIQVTVVFVPVLVLSCWLLSHGWSTYIKADEALGSFQSFRLALVAMEKVSAERGPTNGVLGEDLPIPAERAAALQRARQESDVQVVLLADSLRRSHCSHCSNELTAVNALQSDLATARANVDRLSRLARAERGDGVLQDAVNQMIAIIPKFIPVVTATTARVVMGDTNVLNCLIVSRLTADLREQAGQLGSRFTSALAVRRPLTEDEQFGIERTRGRIDQLRAMIDARSITLAAADPQALATINDQYFGTGLRYITTVRALALQPSGAGISTAQFAQHYVPTMRAITSFRDSVISLAEVEIRKNRRDALLLLVGTGLAEAVLIAVLIWMIAGFRRHVIRPFVQATHIIDAIARDDLTTEITEISARKEISGMFNAMRVLRNNSAERLQLERDRLHLIAELATMAQTDPLTQLLNRRAFESEARTLFEDAKEAGMQIALVMFDIDHFKRINDTYGHNVGDDALRLVADLCRSNWRQSDVVARIGGEEFAVLVRVQTVPQAFDLAQRLRRLIADAQIPINASMSCSITASFGIAFPTGPDDFDVAALLKRADRMLYEAKQAGRNCVILDTGDALNDQFSVPDL